MLRCVYAAVASMALVTSSHAGAAEAARPPATGENFSLVDPALTLIWVAPGSFLMSGTHGAGDDTMVTLTRGYWLGRTEVTQSQWQAVMDSFPLPSHFKGSDRPVEQVSWELAVDFCRRISEQERAAGRLPDGYEYCLPSEAQWEYACRAGTTGVYAGEIEKMAWFDANSGAQSHPVAQKQPNAWGFYDLHGNITEWCADWYGAYPGGSVNDPTGVPNGQFRLVRGGAWSAPAGRCRSAFRLSSPGNHSIKFLGFRLALAPVRSVAPATVK